MLQEHPGPWAAPALPPFPLCKAMGDATSSVKETTPNLRVEMLIRASYAY